MAMMRAYASTTAELEQTPRIARIQAVAFFGGDRQPVEDRGGLAHEQRAALGVERVMLLRGLSPNTLDLAPSQFDYGSIHIYASLEEASYTVKTATDLLTADEVPAALKPFLEFWRTAHAAPVEENVVNGFELLSNKP